MFVFRKKRFFYILFSLCFAFTSYFARNVSNNSLNNRTYDITQVSSIPVTEKVIIVDAGHGRRGWSVLLIQMELRKLILI